MELEDRIITVYLRIEEIYREITIDRPLRDNMLDKRPEWVVRQLCKVRKAVETALSILVDSFSLTKIKAHDLWHFTSKPYRKILAYNFHIITTS